MDLVIFDLDGTLVDSRLDIAQGVNATLRRMGRAPLANERVYSYVGNGAPVLIRKVLGSQATDVEIEEGLEFFLGFYGQHLLDYTRPYPGVGESLERLEDAGVLMAVLTNKPLRPSRAILDGLKMSNFFCQVYGGDSFDLKKPDPIGVAALMGECGVARERTLLVGDSSVDIRTALNAGVMSIGVTYGFQPESLADPAPDRLMDRMEDVADWIIARHNGITNES